MSRRALRAAALLLALLALASANEETPLVSTMVTFAGISDDMTWSISCSDGATLNSGTKGVVGFASHAAAHCKLQINTPSAHGGIWTGFGHTVTVPIGKASMSEAFDICSRVCCQTVVNSAGESPDVLCNCEAEGGCDHEGNLAYG